MKNIDTAEEVTPSPEPAPKPQSLKVAVWDLPTRLFHWTLVAVLGLSWWSAEQDEFEIHLYSGYAILTLLLFRILWGLFGSSTARFRNFLPGPAAVVAYLRDMTGWRAAGHTPIGALSVVALLGLIALQVGTGLFNSDDEGLNQGPFAPLVSGGFAETAQDLHETVFNILLVFVGLHVAAILLFRLVLGKKLVGPMISGKASLDPDAEPMRPARGWAAIVCLLVALAITRWIIGGAPPLGT